MTDEPTRTVHTVTITGIRTGASNEAVARALARVATNISLDKIMKRLESLPWTLTRSATERNASRLVELLTDAGAYVDVKPPLLRQAAPDEWERVPAAPARPGPPSAPATPPGLSVGTESAAQTAAALDMEPLTLGGILDRTFNICRSHFWKLLGIVVIPWLTTIVLVVVGAIVVGVVGFTWHSMGETSARLLIILAAIVVPTLLLVLMAITYMSQGAVIHAVAGIYSGKAVGVVDSYRFVFRRLGRFVLTSMLFVLVILLLVAVPAVVGAALYFLFKVLTPSGWWSVLLWPLLLIPLAYAFPKLMLWDKVVIIEDLAYMKALTRSWDLVTGKAESPWPRGYFIRLIILLHLFLLIYVGVSLVFETPGALLTYLTPQSIKILGRILGQLLSSAGGLVAGIFMSVCLVVFYFDIRTRKEGFDLQMLVGMHEQNESQGVNHA